YLGAGVVGVAAQAAFQLFGVGRGQQVGFVVHEAEGRGARRNIGGPCLCGRGQAQPGRHEQENEKKQLVHCERGSKVEEGLSRLVRTLRSFGYWPGAGEAAATRTFITTFLSWSKPSALMLGRCTSLGKKMKMVPGFASSCWPSTW